MSYTSDKGEKWKIMGISIFCLRKAQLDIRSYSIARIDYIKTQGLETQDLNSFSVDFQQNLLKTGNAYLATKLRT